LIPAHTAMEFLDNFPLPRSKTEDIRQIQEKQGTERAILGWQWPLKYA